MMKELILKQPLIITKDFVRLSPAKLRENLTKSLVARLKLMKVILGVSAKVNVVEVQVEKFRYLGF